MNRKFSYCELDDLSALICCAFGLARVDYLGGCVFTLGQLMGAKGCTLAKKLAREKSYMIIVGEGEYESWK